MVSLYESGCVDQNDLARSFGYSTRTLRRFQQRLHSGGLNALVRPGGRPPGASTGPKPTARDRTILRLKTRGLSNRGIGGRLGLSEMMIRKILRRLGWQPAPEATLLLLPKTDPPTEPATISHSPSDHIPPAAPPPPLQREESGVKPAAQSFDQNPLDRCMPMKPTFVKTGAARRRKIGFTPHNLGTNREQIGDKLPKNTSEPGRSTDT
jgi:hypothetical protein